MNQSAHARHSVEIFNAPYSPLLAILYCHCILLKFTVELFMAEAQAWTDIFDDQNIPTKARMSDEKRRFEFSCAHLRRPTQLRLIEDPGSNILWHNYCRLSVVIA